MMDVAKIYAKKIMSERTSFDGLTLIAICGSIVLFGGIAKMLAWAGAYSDKVMDHYENPRNVGKLDKDADDVGTGMVGAPACGDVMQLQIKVNDDGIIEDARFKTYGCGSAIASSSLLTEWVKGRSLDEAGSIKNSDIAEELALPPVKIHCSVLAEDAIKAAINDYRMKLKK
jgi:nitrogen fixation NifU-like protein